MYNFTATLQIIGVNPYVSVPANILASIFAAAGKSKGPIPIHGTINGNDYTQTLVRYSGEWRLYVNTSMLKHSPQHVGELLEMTISYDERDHTLPLHPKLRAALSKDAEASATFHSLPPSRQHEINRYICSLKSDAKIDENIVRAMLFLHGRGRFVGRDRP